MEELQLISMVILYQKKLCKQLKMLTQSCSLQLVILNTTMQKLDQNKGYLLYEKN